VGLGGNRRCGAVLDLRRILADNGFHGLSQTKSGSGTLVLSGRQYLSRRDGLTGGLAQRQL